MKKPQSKERLGAVTLVIICWIMIMAVVFTSRCGSSDGATGSIESTTDSIVAAGSVATDSVTTQSSDAKPHKNGKTGKRKKRHDKSASHRQPVTRNVLDEPVPVSNRES
ncbi:MAG: hypothetical protein UH625_01355 [Muribaculaceae bacterium]|nr:hypothetical protein [Muribaculaceae bacterium]